MALNHLTTAEMLASTANWSKPGEDIHDAFMAIPSLAALMPRIAAANRGLESKQRVSLDHVLQQLGVARKRADHRHDSYARSAFFILRGHIEKARGDGDAATAAALEEVLALLFPHELEVVKFSYVEEAGQARLLRSRMTPAVEEVLAAIPMQDGTLLDVVNAWLAAGAELGRLEGEVAQAERPGRNGPVAKARHAWMRMVRAVRTMVGLEPPNATIEAALHQLTKAEAAARQRILSGQRRAPEGDAEPDGEPA